jgi:8-amino-7-oxononanoate synthase
MDEKTPLHLKKALHEREEKGLLRQLKHNFPSIDFCSNDYLGFSKTGILKKQIQQTSSNTIGSGGSRLISGNTAFIEETEKHIALFHHAQAALIYNSGYDANLGFLSCVPQKNDLILYDELIHASLYDGIRLSYATAYKFKHNSIEQLKELLQRHQAAFQSIYLVVESIYSMDGDDAPLLEIIDVLKNYKNVFLIVDEAHAIGVFGEQGRGLCQQLSIEKYCFARIYTYGKAMGTHGAAIVGNEVLRNYLINFSRSFIYTTALPNHSIESINAAYQLLLNAQPYREALKENIAYFLKETKGIKGLIQSYSAIQCLVLGSNEQADELEKKLALQNIYAKAIKSPTVKEGSERIRFCLHAFNTKAELDILIKNLK